MAKTTLQPAMLLTSLDEAIEIFLAGFASGVSDALAELGSSAPKSERDVCADGLVAQVRVNPQAAEAVREHVRDLVCDFRSATAKDGIGSGGRRTRRKGADRDADAATHTIETENANG